MNTINKLIGIAKAEIGYLEKRSSTSLYDKASNAGSGNYTKYWEDIKPEYQGQPWSACFVTWCLEKAFGKENAVRLLKHYPYVYCPTMASLFTLHSNPQRGDIVIFKRNGTFIHTGIVTAVNGDYFETIEGNTSGGSSIIANGGGVCKKGYYNSSLPGTKFCRPDYSIVEEEMTMTQYEELKSMIAAQNDKIEALANENEKLKESIGGTFICDYVDDNMPQWAREAVNWCVDKGIITGTGKDENGNKTLGLNYMQLWVCVVVYRVCEMLNK